MIYVIIFICFVVAILSYPMLHAYFLLDEQLLLINKLVQSKKLPEAKKKLRALPKSVKNYGQVLFIKHKIEALQKNYRMALYYLNEIELGKRYKPQKSITIKNVGLAKISILEKMGNKEEIVNTCKKLIRIDPTDVEIMAKLSKNFFAMKNEGAAKPYLREAIRRGSNDYLVYLMFAMICIREKKFPDALTAINKSITLCEGINCKLMETRIEILYELAYYDDVIVYEKKIDEIYHRSMKTRACVALSYLKLNRKRDAYTMFKKFLDKHINDYSPQIIEARYNFSEILAEDGEHESVLQQLVMIERGKKDHLDTKERREMYELFFAYPEVAQIVFKKTPEKTRIFFESLIPKNLFLKEAYYENLHHQVCAFVLSKRISGRNKIERSMLIIQYKALPLKMEELKQDIDTISKEFEIYATPYKLNFYSFYNVNNDKLKDLKKFNTKLNLVIGRKFFECINKKSLFANEA